MNEIDAGQLLTQMKMLAAKASQKEVVDASSQSETVFGGMFKQAINHVNQQQVAAQELSEKFELGDESVNLAQVMIALQKANISLQTATQVRNKLVNAYQDIMNMPI